MENSWGEKASLGEDIPGFPPLYEPLHIINRHSANKFLHKITRAKALAEPKKI